jgi:uncharacterized membrane protein
MAPTRFSALGRTGGRAGGRAVPAWIPTTSLVLSLVAVGLTTYLTVTHYTDPAALACPDTGVVNCTLVTTSSWSMVAGVPVAVLGLAWALGMTALSLPRTWRSTAPWVDTLRLVGVSAGGVMVLYLVYVELFRVGAICLWCTGVHLTALALLAVTLAARPLLARGRRRPGATG